MSKKTRRSFLKKSSAALAAISAGSALVTKASAQSRPAATVASGGLFSVVETASGKVQGITTTGIHEFKGIPYGAPTGGKNRYLPPKKPAPWTGVRECFAYTSVCPQTQADIRGEYGQLIMWDRQVGGMGEDCLSLNVWTTTVDRAAKKPVFVCFHGGGFA